MADVPPKATKWIVDTGLVIVDIYVVSAHRRRHANGRYGHGHTAFRSTMATDGFGHSTMLFSVYAT